MVLSPFFLFLCCENDVYALAYLRIGSYAPDSGVARHKLKCMFKIAGIWGRPEAAPSGCRTKPWLGLEDDLLDSDDSNRKGTRSVLPFLVLPGFFWSVNMTIPTALKNA